MPTSTADLVPSIRHASRQLVREWGFMQPDRLAGTDLSSIAVHALIEIGDYGVATVPLLAAVLRVDVAQAKRAVYELLGAELLSWRKPLSASAQRLTSPVDGALQITDKGAATLARVHAYASTEVQSALDTIPDSLGALKVSDGLTLYAEALRSLKKPATTVTVTPIPLESDAMAITMQNAPQGKHHIQIVSGYRPGIVSRSMDMHMAYYSQTLGWGDNFERSMAHHMSLLIDRLKQPSTEVFAAIETVEDGSEKIVGTIFVDGEQRGKPGVLGRIRCKSAGAT